MNLPPMRMENAVDIDLGKIFPQSRLDPRYFSKGRLEPGVKRFREKGQLKPLVVCEKSEKKGDYVLLRGDYVWSVLKAAGAKTAKCCILNTNEKPPDTDDFDELNRMLAAVYNVRTQYAPPIVNLGRSHLAAILQLPENDPEINEAVNRFFSYIKREWVFLTKRNSVAKSEAQRIFANGFQPIAFAFDLPANYPRFRRLTMVKDASRDPVTIDIL